MTRTLPYAPNSGTSREAALRAVSKAAADRARIAEFMRRRGAYGATRQEAEDGLRIEGNTLRPRWRELEIAVVIVNSGRKRRTRSGCPAEVYIWTPPESSQLGLGV